MYMNMGAHMYVSVHLYLHNDISVSLSVVCARFSLAFSLTYFLFLSVSLCLSVSFSLTTTYIHILSFFLCLSLCCANTFSLPSLPPLYFLSLSLPAPLPLSLSIPFSPSFPPFTHQIAERTQPKESISRFQRPVPAISRERINFCFCPHTKYTRSQQTAQMKQSISRFQGAVPVISSRLNPWRCSWRRVTGPILRVSAGWVWRVRELTWNLRVCWKIPTTR